MNKLITLYGLNYSLLALCQTYQIVFVLTNEQATTKARVMADKMATYKWYRFTFIEGVKIGNWADVNNTVTGEQIFLKWL